MEEFNNLVNRITDLLQNLISAAERADEALDKVLDAETSGNALLKELKDSSTALSQFVTALNKAGTNAGFKRLETGVERINKLIQGIDGKNLGKLNQALNAQVKLVNDLGTLTKTQQTIVEGLVLSTAAAAREVNEILVEFKKVNTELAGMSQSVAQAVAGFDFTRALTQVQAIRDAVNNLNLSNYDQLIDRLGKIQDKIEKIDQAKLERVTGGNRQQSSSEVLASSNDPEERRRRVEKAKLGKYNLKLEDVMPDIEVAALDLNKLKTHLKAELGDASADIESAIGDATSESMRGMSDRIADSMRKTLAQFKIKLIKSGTTDDLEIAKKLEELYSVLMPEKAVAEIVKTVRSGDTATINAAVTKFGKEVVSAVTNALTDTFNDAQIQRVGEVIAANKDRGRPTPDTKAASVEQKKLTETASAKAKNIDDAELIKRLVTERQAMIERETELRTKLQAQLDKAASTRRAIGSTALRTRTDLFAARGADQIQEVLDRFIKIGPLSAAYAPEGERERNPDVLKLAEEVSDLVDRVREVLRENKDDPQFAESQAIATAKGFLQDEGVARLVVQRVMKEGAVVGLTADKQLAEAADRLAKNVRAEQEARARIIARGGTPPTVSALISNRLTREQQTSLGQRLQSVDTGVPEANQRVNVFGRLLEGAKKLFSFDELAGSLKKLRDSITGADPRRIYEFADALDRLAYSLEKNARVVGAQFNVARTMDELDSAATVNRTRINTNKSELRARRQQAIERNAEGSNNLTVADALLERKRVRREGARTGNREVLYAAYENVENIISKIEEPVEKLLGAGFQSTAFKQGDRVLKVTVEMPGSDTFVANAGRRSFDAPMENLRAYEDERGRRVYTYNQPQADVKGVTDEQYAEFKKKLLAEGYFFTDPKKAQTGLVDGEVKLIDYNAVKSIDALVKQYGEKRAMRLLKMYREKAFVGDYDGTVDYRLPQDTSDDELKRQIEAAKARIASGEDRFSPDDPLSRTRYSKAIARPRESSTDAVNQTRIMEFQENYVGILKKIATAGETAVGGVIISANALKNAMTAFGKRLGDAAPEGLKESFRELKAKVDALVSILDQVKDYYNFVDQGTGNVLKTVPNVRDYSLKELGEIAKRTVGAFREDFTDSIEPVKLSQGAYLEQAKIYKNGKNVTYADAGEQSTESLRSQTNKRVIEEAFASTASNVLLLGAGGSPHFGSMYHELADGVKLALDHAMLAVRDEVTGAIRLMELRPGEGAENLVDNPSDAAMLASKAGKIRSPEELKYRTLTAVPVELEPDAMRKFIAEVSSRQMPGAVYSFATAVGEQCSSSIAAGIRAAGLDPKFGRSVAGVNTVTPAKLFAFFENLTERGTGELSSDDVTRYSSLVNELDERFTKVLDSTFSGFRRQDVLSVSQGLSLSDRSLERQIVERFAQLKGTDTSADDLRGYAYTREALNRSLASKSASIPLEEPLERNIQLQRQMGVQLGEVIGALSTTDTTANDLSRSFYQLTLTANNVDRLFQILAGYSNAMQQANPAILETFFDQMAKTAFAIKELDFDKFKSSLGELDVTIGAVSTGSWVASEIVNPPTGDGDLDNASRKEISSTLTALKTGVAPLDKASKYLGEAIYASNQVASAMNATKEFMVASRQLNVGTAVDMVSATLKFSDAVQNLSAKFLGNDERGRNRNLLSGAARYDRTKTILGMVEAGALLFGKELGLEGGSGIRLRSAGSAKKDDKRNRIIDQVLEYAVEGTQLALRSDKVPEEYTSGVKTFQGVVRSLQRYRKSGDTNRLFKDLFIQGAGVANQVMESRQEFEDGMRENAERVLAQTDKEIVKRRRKRLYGAREDNTPKPETIDQLAAYVVARFEQDRFGGKTTTTPERESARKLTEEMLKRGKRIPEQSGWFGNWWRGPRNADRRYQDARGIEIEFIEAAAKFGIKLPTALGDTITGFRPESTRRVGDLEVTREAMKKAAEEAARRPLTEVRRTKKAKQAESPPASGAPVSVSPVSADEAVAKIREAGEELKDVAKRASDSGINALISGNTQMDANVANSIREILKNLSEKDLARVKAVEDAIRSLFKGTSVEKVVNKGGYAVVDEDTLTRIFRDVFGENSDQFKELTSLIEKGGTAGISGVLPEGNQFGASVRGRQRTDISASEAVVHELVHMVTNDLQKTVPDLFKTLDTRTRSAVLSNPDTLKAVKSSAAGISKKYENLVADFGENVAYFLDPREVLSNVGQVMISGNKELERVFRELYGDELFNEAVNSLRKNSKDVFGKRALAKLQASFSEFDATVTRVIEEKDPTLLESIGEWVRSDPMLAPIASRLDSVAKNAGPAIEKSVKELFGKLQDNIDAALQAAGNTADIGGAGVKAYLKQGSLVDRTIAGILDSGDLRTSISQILEDPSLGTVGRLSSQAFSGITGVKDIESVRQTIGKLPPGVINFGIDAFLDEFGKRFSEVDLSSYYFDKFNEEFKKQTGEVLRRQDFRVEEFYDFDNGITRLSASARTAAGAMTSLNGEIDKTGEFSVRRQRRGMNMLDYAREEIKQEIPEELFEEAIQNFIMQIEMLFSSILNIQDEIAQVQILMEEAARGMDVDVDKASRSFVDAAITAAAKTGQGFEEAVRTFIQNFRLTGGIKDLDNRTYVAERLSNIQLGSQTVFDLSLEQSLETIPAIFSQLRDNISRSNPTLTTDEISSMATAKLETLMDQFVVAQRESGANAQDLVQVYASLASSAKDIGLDSTRLLSITAAASVKLAKTPEETANSLKMFIERTYSNEGTDALSKFGVATRGVDAQGNVVYRALDDIIADINKVISGNEQLGKAIAQELGGRARAGEVSAILSSAPEADRVFNQVQTGTLGDEFDQEIERKSDLFIGSMNKLKANMGAFINTTLFSSGALNELGSALATISGHFKDLAQLLAENGDKLEWLQPLFFALGESLIYRFLNLGKVFIGLLKPLNNLGLTVRNVFTSFSNLNAPAASDRTRLAEGAAAAIDKFKQLGAEGKITGELVDSSVAGMANAFKLLAAQVEAAKLEMVELAKAAGTLEKRPGTVTDNPSGSKLNPMIAQRSGSGNRAMEKMEGIIQRILRGEATSDDMRRYNLQQRLSSEAPGGSTTRGLTDRDLRMSRELDDFSNSIDDLRKSEQALKMERAAATRNEAGLNAAKQRNIRAFANLTSGIDRLRAFLGGVTSRSVTGVSSFMASERGDKVRKWTGAAGDMVLPVAMDIMLKGNNPEAYTSIGAGIAGGIVGTMLAPGYGTVVGYTIAQGYAEWLDLYGQFGTSTTEQKGMSTSFANILREEVKYAGKTDEERARLEQEEKDRIARQTEKARDLILKNLGLDDESLMKLATDTGNSIMRRSGDVRVTDLRKYAQAYLKGPDEYTDATSNARTLAGITPGEDYYEYELKLMDEIIAKAPRLLELLANDDAVSGSTTISEYLKGLQENDALLEEAIHLVDQFDEAVASAGSEDGITPLVKGWSQALEESRERLSQFREASMSSFDMPGADALTRFGDFGSSNLALNEAYMPQFEAIAAGRMSDEQSGAVFEAYDRQRETIAGIPELESQLKTAGEALGQTFTNLREDLYAIGPEGQDAIQSMIGPLIEMIQYTQEYEAILEEINALKARPEYMSGVGTEGYQELNAEILALEGQASQMRELYDLRVAYLNLIRQSAGALQNELNVQKVKTAAERKRTVTPGTPARFRMPSLIDVDEYSTSQLLDALDAARQKQASILKMFPQMAEEFAKEQFMLEANGQFKGVTGVSQSFFQEALNQNRNQRMEAPDTVDLRDQSPEKIQKILEDARALQAKAVALAPDLAQEFSDDRLLIMQKNNELLLETGLSQEYLQAAIEANTEATDDNTLRGHYNLPASYRPPTIWDYYDQGGTEAGGVNFVAPPGSESGGMVSLDMAKNIAEAIANQGSGENGLGPDLSGLGNLIDPGARPLGYPEPGTPGKVIIEEPEVINTDQLLVNGVPIGQYVLPDGTVQSADMFAFNPDRLDALLNKPEEIAKPSNMGFTIPSTNKLVDPNAKRGPVVPLGPPTQPSNWVAPAPRSWQSLENGGIKDELLSSAYEEPAEKGGKLASTFEELRSVSGNFKRDSSQFSMSIATMARDLVGLNTNLSTATKGTGAIGTSMSQLSLGAANFSGAIASLLNQVRGLNISRVFAEAITAGKIQITIDNQGQSRATVIGSTAAPSTSNTGRGSPSLRGSTGPNRI